MSMCVVFSYRSVTARVTASAPNRWKRLPLRSAYILDNAITCEAQYGFALVSLAWGADIARGSIIPTALLAQARIVTEIVRVKRLSEATVVVACLASYFRVDGTFEMRNDTWSVLDAAGKPAADWRAVYMGGKGAGFDVVSISRAANAAAVRRFVASATAADASTSSGFGSIPPAMEAKQTPSGCRASQPAFA
jgi:hypothetical protein